MLTSLPFIPGPYTVFAPTDEAWNRLSHALQTKLRSNPELLKQTLLYHIVPGIVTSRNFADEVRLPTLAKNNTLITRVYADRVSCANFQLAKYIYIRQYDFLNAGEALRNSETHYI